MNTYDTAHMLHHLRQWQDAMQAAEQRLEALSKLTGSNPEGPFFEALYGVMGLAVGDIVYSKYGRRMRVERTNEYVSNGETATGPYCALQALDDKNCDAIWPRRWYTKRGDTLQLDLRSGT